MTHEDQPAAGAHRPSARPHPLAVALHERLVAAGLTLAFAESCTGGLIADLVTDISGSSAYFLGSAVTYANSAKQGIVGVRAETLADHGAVSAETAAEMAQGARRVYGADIAASVTGIAGPTGRDARQAGGAGLHPPVGGGRGVGRAARLGRRPVRQQGPVGGGGVEVGAAVSGASASERRNSTSRDHNGRAGIVAASFSSPELGADDVAALSPHHEASVNKHRV